MKHRIKPAQLSVLVTALAVVVYILNTILMKTAIADTKLFLAMAVANASQTVMAVIGIVFLLMDVWEAN